MVSANTSPPENNCLSCERRPNTHTRGAGAWGWTSDEMLRYICDLVTLHASSEKRMGIMTWISNTCSLMVSGTLCAGRSSVSMMKSKLGGDHWFCIVVEAPQYHLRQRSWSIRILDRIPDSTCLHHDIKLTPFNSIQVYLYSAFHDTIFAKQL